MSTFALHTPHVLPSLHATTKAHLELFPVFCPPNSQQADALAAVKGALQDDPTCLDTHHSGCALPEQEDKKEVIDGN